MKKDLSILLLRERASSVWWSRWRHCTVSYWSFLPLMLCLVSASVFCSSFCLCLCLYLVLSLRLSLLSPQSLFLHQFLCFCFSFYFGLSLYVSILVPNSALPVSVISCLYLSPFPSLPLPLCLSLSVSLFILSAVKKIEITITSDWTECYLKVRRFLLVLPWTVKIAWENITEH